MTISKEQYNKVLSDAQKFYAQSNYLKQHVQQLEAVLRQKDEEISQLNHTINELENIDAFDLTFNQLKSLFGTSFKANNMPQASGIYGYINHSTKEVYVGQSVNMGRRLKQHARSGKIVIAGKSKHFTEDDIDWTYHVLDYIDRDDKEMLDIREAHWIAIAKLATLDKVVIDGGKLKKYVNGETDDIDFYQKYDGKGEVTNKTRGNNIQM